MSLEQAEGMSLPGPFMMRHMGPSGNDSQGMIQICNVMEGNIQKK